MAVGMSKGAVSTLRERRYLTYWQCIYSPEVEIQQIGYCNPDRKTSVPGTRLGRLVLPESGKRKGRVTDRTLSGRLVVHFVFRRGASHWDKSGSVGWYKWSW